MSIETKNYGQIVYRNPFHYIPARYLKMDVGVKSASIKEEITRFLNDVMNEPTNGVYTLAKADLDNKVWDTASTHHDPTKTEDGVKEWEKATRLVKEYLEKKVV